MAHYYKKLENDAAISYVKGCELDGTPIVILKIETTGLNPKIDEICGIRALKFVIEPDQIKPIDTFKTLVKTYKPLSTEVTNINGITNEMLKESGVSLNEAMNKLNEYIDCAVICGFNTKEFLYPFLFQAMKEESVKMSALGGFDIIDLAATTVLPIGNKGGYSQKMLFELFHIKDTNITGFFQLFQKLKQNLPTGSKDVPSDFITDSKNITKNGIKHIEFNTKAGKLDLNCWTHYFEDMSDTIFETYDVDSIIRYILKKTKSQSLYEAIDKLY